MTLSPLFLFDSVEKNYIPLETLSQANIPVTPSEPECSKGKGKRHGESLITAKKWTPIATQRSRKPRNSESMQGKPILTTCTAKINIINQAATCKGKFPTSADRKFVQGTVKETLPSKETIQTTKKACSEAQDLEQDNLDTVEPQTIGLERHGSSSSVPPAPQRFISTEHGQQEVQYSISLGRTWGKLPEDLSQRDRLQKPYGNHQTSESYQAVQIPGGKGKLDKVELRHYQCYRRNVNPDRAYSDYFRLTRSNPNQLSSGFTPFINQQVSDQQSPFFTIPRGFQEKTRIQRAKQDSFQPRERESDPMMQKLLDLVKEVHKNQK
ncbi:hypothetical protein O181_022042 [Austropuccinia psidii MF-1]|uniref:Uncharacterized protein n=1 Tax=Austropuccinia psidii MF-1 TaxID=1389203 RepID=A0A9Q3CGP9_9BASI|nr:hypothetical protein [Austropuccinia psidii MF-1]